MAPKATATKPKAPAGDHASYQGKTSSTFTTTHRNEMASISLWSRLSLLYGYRFKNKNKWINWRVISDMITDAIVNLKDVCLPSPNNFLLQRLTLSHSAMDQGTLQCYAMRKVLLFSRDASLFTGTNPTDISQPHRIEEVCQGQQQGQCRGQDVRFSVQQSLEGRCREGYLCSTKG